MTTLATFKAAGRTYAFHDVRREIGTEVHRRLPYVARVLAENILRHIGRPGVTRAQLDALVDPAVSPDTVALPLHVPRVVLPDSSGIPVLMDLAALRSEIARRGGDPERIDAGVPIAFMVDHSLQVDAHASADAEAINLARELERNGERYRFLKWAEGAFNGLQVFPPGAGIIHQIHLEQVAAVTLVDDTQTPAVAFPDFAIGGDSHTPMVNALGVLGWGVGGIEIETAVLGEPYIIPKPEFVGVRLDGVPAAGITSTDIVLTVTQALRAAGVVGAFVEFFGPGASALTVPDRATLANMAPDYGATTGFWPVDEQTLAYLRLTGRSEGHVALVEAHARAAGVFRNAGAPDPVYDQVIPIDLAGVRRSIAGPGMPHIRQDTADVAASFRARARKSERPDASGEIPEGAIAIAAITSCTNTANAHGMIRAGLLARNAAARGLTPKPWVKTSLAPGSRAVTTYLERAGLLAPLEALGFHVIGYGCTTCGGKSGPLKPVVTQAVEQHGRAVAAVLSGNRNFDGRIHRLVGASYLCSPALVIAFALAGRVTIDIDRDALATDASGAPVFLRDLWPDDAEVDAIVKAAVTPDVFASTARPSPLVKAGWEAISAPRGVLFAWDAGSNYIVEPPFFAQHPSGFATASHVAGARVLGVYADGMTTDHVSPGGEIPADSPAGQYLLSLGIAPSGFNSYIGRRGNHHVMARGTYSNLRTRNRMTDREGWWTTIHPDGDIVTVFEAATRYRERSVPLIVLGGRDFGTGSSRDWAAKGPALLGVQAVIANSFERIHRSNLIGVGIVPLLFAEKDNVDTLGLDGSEEFAFEGVSAAIAGRGPIAVTARRSNGEEVHFGVQADVRSVAEADLLRRGGMFQAALERMASVGGGAVLSVTPLVGAMRDFDLVIVGAGVAGLTAAMFAGRYGLKVAVVEQLGAGGQIINAERIENFPGFPQGLGGHELGPLLHEQAESAGAEFTLDIVQALEADREHHIVRGASESLRGRAVIIAAGSALCPLGVAGEERLRGRGVSHCASCDGAFFAGQNVCVIGGGDSALDEALVLAEHAERVTIIHRGASLDAQEALRGKAAASRKIDIVPQTAVEEIVGTEVVSAVRLRDLATGTTSLQEVRGVFVYVGLEPNTAFLRGVLALDATGHIETDISMCTSLAGVFAAGDIRRHSVAQLAAAAGDGATAAISAFRYLTSGNLTPQPSRR